MTRSRRRALLVLAALLCLVAGLTLWDAWVPSLADGSSCAARVYSYGPGGGAAHSSGERAPDKVDTTNTLCREAAHSAWWWGTALLTAGAVVAVSGFGSGRQARRESPQPDAVGSDATSRTAKRE